MELSFAFLAQHADYTDDKALWVAGADFDRISLSALPSIAQFTLVVKFLVFPDDIGGRHLIRVEYTDPEGTRAKPTQSSEVPTHVSEPDPRKRHGAILVIRMAMPFNTPGEYFFHVMLNDKEVKTISLLVEAAAPKGVEVVPAPKGN